MSVRRVPCAGCSVYLLDAVAVVHIEVHVEHAVVVLAIVSGTCVWAARALVNTRGCHAL